MGVLFSFFRRKDPPKPIEGVCPRFKNILANNFRGIFGTIVPLAALPWHFSKDDDAAKIAIMWLMMLWFFIVQPVNIPVTALIPIFFLPMTGVMPTKLTCDCYMSEGIAMFILGSMLILLLNNAGVDKRIALWFLCSGDASQYSGMRMVFKASTAAFFLSMFSNRLLACSVITQYVASSLGGIQGADADDAKRIRNIVCNAIQTSSSIGSIGLIHASFATLTFRTIFYASVNKEMEWPDIFNFFQYTVFAFPVAFIMFLLNLGYHMFLMKLAVRNDMAASTLTSLKDSFNKVKKDIPGSVTLHEQLALLFLPLSLAAFFTRWSKFLNNGWGDFRTHEQSSEVPFVKDATVAAFFVILLHTLPKGYGFTKYLFASTRNELGELKAESAIMWWRFVDKNLNYGYIFLIGSGVALSVSTASTTLRDDIAREIGDKYITGQSWNIGLLIVCVIALVLPNIMSGCAACVIFLPFIVNMVPPKSDSRSEENVWVKKLYLGALAVGVGSSLGFMWPFLYTPGYFCHYTGKVPKLKMAKYSIGSVIICLVILWLSLSMWAPIVWNDVGYAQLDLAKPTEAAPAGGD